MDIVPQGVEKRMLDLKVKKASIENDIPAKIIIRCNELISNYLAHICNNSKNDRNYPSSFKLGTIIPINKNTRTLRMRIIVQ